MERHHRRAKKAEEASRRHGPHVEQLLASSPAVIYSFKAIGRLSRRPLSARTSGTGSATSRSEYLDSPDFWRNCVHPDDLGRVEGEFGQLSSRAATPSNTASCKKDGSYCWVSDELQLVRDKNGATGEVVGSWSDITARKAAEEAAGGDPGPCRAPAGLARRR